MQDLKILIVEHLHGIIISIEMRKGGPLDMREVDFKATHKGKEKESPKDISYISNDEEANFMRRLQVGTRKFRGKLPFKHFSLGRVGHYASKCPYKENHKENGNSVACWVVLYSFHD